MTSSFNQALKQYAMLLVVTYSTWFKKSFIAKYIYHTLKMISTFWTLVPGLTNDDVWFFGQHQWLGHYVDPANNHSWRIQSILLIIKHASNPLSKYSLACSLYIIIILWQAIYILFLMNNIYIIHSLTWQKIKHKTTHIGKSKTYHTWHQLMSLEPQTALRFGMQVL